MPSLPEMRIKAAKYAKNINKRGRVGRLSSRPEKRTNTGPMVVALLLFVLVGSAVFQLLRGQFL